MIFVIAAKMFLMLLTMISLVISLVAILGGCFNLFNPKWGAFLLGIVLLALWLGAAVACIFYLIPWCVQEIQGITQIYS